jgi:thiamine transport system permease protein
MGIAALIFLACFTSFTIVLALGGGPGVATLEVAIFEALRFAGDFQRAAVLALVQIGVCLAVMAPLTWLLSRRPSEAASTGFLEARPDASAPLPRLIDSFFLVIGGAFVLGPLAVVLVSGTAGLASLADRLVIEALTASLLIGSSAGLMSLLLALALASLGRHVRIVLGRRVLADLVGLAAVIVLVVSPIALSGGLFVALRPVVDPFLIGPPLIVLVNALMALPFTYRQVEPPLLVTGERYGALSQSLGVRGMARLRFVEWPLLRGPAIVALAMATSLSLGDLGVAAFFGSGRLVTLPVLLYERLGSYRLGEAAAVALLLSVLVLALFLLAQRWSGDWIARSR